MRHACRHHIWTGVALAAMSVGLAACSGSARFGVEESIGPNPRLPPPEKSLLPVVNVAPAVGWSEGRKPLPAPGLAVTAFADGLDHPRWLYVLPNGDVLVAESNAPERPESNRGLRAWFAKRIMGKAGATTKSADRITLLRDSNGDGIVDQRTVFLKDLYSPFGMALVGDDFYVANSDAVLRFPYQEGQTQMTVPGEKLVDLPAGPRNHHWTKNLIASPDGRKLYVTVGSNSNVGEYGLEVEQGRAAIWEVDTTSGEHRIFASGLRNPNGLAWEPRTGVLWTVVNERDEIGHDLVPDYLTSVRNGGFYGWPYSYYGQHVDERVRPQQPALVAQAIVPDYALGAHVAALGLASAQGNALTPEYAEGMFIGEHGSWNRRPHSGYKVVFVPFADGRPQGAPRDVLAGFLSGEGKAYGRPVGVALDKQGALLVADDVGNVIWRVTSAR